jgi:hypothetical protein
MNEKLRNNWIISSLNRDKEIFNIKKIIKYILFKNLKLFLFKNEIILIYQ